MHLDDARLWIAQHLARSGSATGDELVALMRAEHRCDPHAARVLLDDMVVTGDLVQRIEVVEADDGHADLRYLTWFALTRDGTCPTPSVARTV